MLSRVFHKELHPKKSTSSEILDPRTPLILFVIQTSSTTDN